MTDADADTGLEAGGGPMVASAALADLAITDAFRIDPARVTDAALEATVRRIVREELAAFAESLPARLAAIERDPRHR